MSESDFDHLRYRNLLAAADDEPKRMALIDLLIAERARDRLARQVAPNSSDKLVEFVLKAKK